MRNTIFSILLSIFLIIFIFSLPFPAILKKTKQVEVNNTLDSLDILIEEIENGISVLEAWSVARDGENFLELKEKEISDIDLLAIFRITKLSTNYGVALAPLLRSCQSELLAKKEELEQRLKKIQKDVASGLSADSWSSICRTRFKVKCFSKRVAPAPMDIAPISGASPESGSA